MGEGVGVGSFFQGNRLDEESPSVEDSRLRGTLGTAGVPVNSALLVDRLRERQDEAVKLLLLFFDGKVDEPGEERARGIFWRTVADEGRGLNRHINCRINMRPEA